MNSKCLPPDHSIAIIPARGGSRGVPRKNLRWIAGKPLLCHVITSAQQAGVFGTICVSSEDPEILALAESMKARPIRRPSHLSQDHIPLDPVVEDCLRQIRPDPAWWTGRVAASLQPTSPLLSPSTIRLGCDRFRELHVDTLFVVKRDTHLAWRINPKSCRWEPLFRRRLNRQQLPPTFRESGSIVFFTPRLLLETHTRFGKKVSAVEIAGPEALDIDSPDQMALAEYHLGGSQRVALVCSPRKEDGYAALYRSLYIADRLGTAQPHFVVHDPTGESVRMLRRHHYPVAAVSRLDAWTVANQLTKLKPRLILNDTRDTSPRYIQALQALGVPVVSVNDCGPGGKTSDLLLNKTTFGMTPEAGYTAAAAKAKGRQTQAIDRIRELLLTR